LIAKYKFIAKSLGHEILDRPFELNIWGFRSVETQPNRFDDEMHVFFNINEAGGLPQWKSFVFPCTTDPSTYWLQNPMRPQGTAILKEGQYKGVYAIDLHRGKYKALCQRNGEVTVRRDSNKDNFLNFDSSYEESGLLGINIHRASSNGVTKTIDKHSAGCQVLQNVEHFKLLMELAELHRNRYGNSFSYTLVDFKSRLKAMYKTTAIGGGLIGTVFGLYKVIQHLHKTHSNAQV